MTQGPTGCRVGPGPGVGSGVCVGVAVGRNVADVPVAVAVALVREGNVAVGAVREVAVAVARGGGVCRGRDVLVAVGRVVDVGRAVAVGLGLGCRGQWRTSCQSERTRGGSQPTRDVCARKQRYSGPWYTTRSPTWYARFGFQATAASASHVAMNVTSTNNVIDSNRPRIVPARIKPSAFLDVLCRVARKCDARGLYAQRPTRTQTGAAPGSSFTVAAWARQTCSEWETLAPAL